MAVGDYAGGGGTDRSSIYNQAAPAIAASDAVNWAWGLSQGQEQIIGGQTKDTPGQKVFGIGKPVPGKGGSLSTALSGTPRYYQTPGQPATYTSLDAALTQLHGLPPDKLKAYTQKLYAAGLYPDSAYSKGQLPPSGLVVTDTDVKATINLISTAQRYIEYDRDADGKVIGRKVRKTIDEIINEFTAANEGQKKLEQAAAQRQGSVYQVTTSDPATIRSQVTSVARALLGRDVSDQEQAALVDQMLNAERAPQEAAIRAGQQADAGGDVRLATARVDTEARLKERLEAQNPAEAQAYGEMNYVDIMRQMIGGGGQQNG